MKRALRWAGLILLVAAVAALVAAVWARGRVRASLPRMEGEIRLSGLASPARVDFDARGVPAIRARDRIDLARATGFLHAQNRFFQMDLMRRQAAGELSALLGAAALPADRVFRRHRFRDLAGRVVAAASEEDRSVIQAYAEGASAGLTDLGDAPFEYLVLGADPEPWRPEDSVLVILAMFLTLNDADGSNDSRLGLMHDLLPSPLFEFLAPLGTEWDAPLVGDPIEIPPLPGPEVIDLRTSPSARAPSPPPRDDPFVQPGSNNWAVAGSRTLHGGALLANDMHLILSVPNIWYRASFVLEGGGMQRTVTGVTLPGTPAMVAGSNGHVAWGFTNSQGDWTDLVVLEPDPDDADAYLTPDGSARFVRHLEAIRVRGADDETLEVLWTIWGPVIDTDHRGRKRALRWIAHDARAVNLGLIRMETARSLDDAMAIAPLAGIPPQNLLVADATGRIGWTIMGAIPSRLGQGEGFDARLPASWADGSHGWNGWLDPADYPRVLDPGSGILWTANARAVDGGMLRRIGHGGYDLGARARQIRDDLAGSDGLAEADMLAVQLDDRALFLRRWRDRLETALADSAAQSDPRRSEARRLVRDWSGHASIDSPGYRLARAFRLTVAERVFEPLTAPCREESPGFNYLRTEQWEGPLWRILEERPAHLLDPRHDSWDALLLEAADAAIEAVAPGGAALAERTWGERNTTRIRHPLSPALPFLSGWLDMTQEPLPGDSNMPRVQTPVAGASQRMAVSPGREADGYFHMPGGQSGHPWSPHYKDGHEGWAEGRLDPFLPGQPAKTLILRP